MPTYTSGTPSPAIPVSWTDDPLQQNVTIVKKAHLTGLRTALETLDGHIHVFAGHNSNGESPAIADPSWGEASAAIIVDSTKVKATHFNELITYLKLWDIHYHVIPNFDGAAGTPGHDVNKNSTNYDPTFAFIDDPVVTDVTPPKAASWEELRTYLESFATHTHDACCECECQCTCTCTCTGNCGCTCNCTCTCKTC